MADTRDNPCVVSQELINLQCLQCGAVSSGNILAIAECLSCGALDYHVFRSFVPLEVATNHRRARTPDNEDVINKMINLVQDKAR